MCLKAREGARAGSPAGSSGRGGISPERPLSPPQGQRWPPWAPPPSAPASAGALRRRRRQHRCPGPRRHPPAAGSGTGRGAAGARAPPPAMPLPPPSARPAPLPGPRPPPSPCRGTPASTASRRRHCLPPRSPRRPRPAPAPTPAPAPVPRRCAGPVAGISSARPAFLFSYAISILDGVGVAAATQKSPGSGQCTPVLAAPSWGRARGLEPLYLPFSFRPGWGKAKGNPKKPTENTHRIGDYLFVFNLFCHIFVKRQRCNKKYISTVPKDGAVERELKGPNDLRFVPALWGSGRPGWVPLLFCDPWGIPPKNWVSRPQMENSRLPCL